MRSSARASTAKAYAHLTPLCFSDVSRTDDEEWAAQATQTTPQIIFKQLNLNVPESPDTGQKHRRKS